MDSKAIIHSCKTNKIKPYHVMEETKSEMGDAIPFERQKNKRSTNKSKNRASVNYPPYVGCHGSIAELFEKIRQASVPPKFTQDYMSTVLGMKSSSHRAFIPLLKKLGFIDQSSIPTEAYCSYRDEENSRYIMAQKVREAYSDIYMANEYAHKLDRKELVRKLKTITGTSENDTNISLVAGTFIALKELADFNYDSDNTQPIDTVQQNSSEQPILKNHSSNMNKNKLGLSYTINLNLPATSDIKVFNAIFSSLREHIIDGN